MILSVNNDYFLEPLDLCNGEVWCSLWGTNWILKYYLDGLRLQRLIIYSVQVLLSKEFEILQLRISMRLYFTAWNRYHLEKPIIA